MGSTFDEYMGTWISLYKRKHVDPNDNCRHLNICKRACACASGFQGGKLFASFCIYFIRESHCDVTTEMLWPKNTHIIEERGGH